VFARARTAKWKTKRIVRDFALIRLQDEALKERDLLLSAFAFCFARRARAKSLTQTMLSSFLIHKWGCLSQHSEMIIQGEVLLFAQARKKNKTVFPSRRNYFVTHTHSFQF
jgi:hypothetical protein